MIHEKSRGGLPLRKALAVLIVTGALAVPAFAQTHVRFDAFAAPLLVLSGDGLAPVLPHVGLSFGGGAELHAGSWIPVRLQTGFQYVFPSRMDSAGELYRSWAGWALSLASGAQVLRSLGPRPLALDLLGGVSFAADRYPGTTVAFASFAVDVLARADFSAPGRGGLRVRLPLSYIFRPGARSFSAGLGVEWGFPPLPLRGRKEVGADGREEP